MIAPETAGKLNKQPAVFLSRTMILNSGLKDYFENASWISPHISSKTAHAGSRPETCH